MKRHRLKAQFPQPPPDKVLDILEKRVYGYRHWERRVKFLLATINKNLWNDSILNKYKNKNLRRIKDFLLKCTSLKYPIGLKNEVQFLLQKIRTKIDIPPTYSDPKRSICNPITLVVGWNECMLQKIPVKRIIIEAKDLPITVPKQALNNIIVGKKLPLPIGNLICNFRKAAKTYNNFKPPDNKCPCRKLFDSKFRPNNQCVLTGDTSITSCLKLQQLPNEGAGYRENIESAVIDSLLSSLKSLTHKLEDKFATPAHQFEPWIDNIIETITSQLKAPPKTTSDLPDPTIKKALNFLHRHLVICTADKAPKNFIFVCRHHYRQVLSEELHSQEGAYTTTPLSKSDIYSKYKQELFGQGGKVPTCIAKPLHCMPPQSARLPFLYWLPKMHKSPPSARFIASSSNVLTTKLATSINSILSLIKKELLEKDLKHIAKTGVKRCWFVDNHSKVIAWLKHLPRPQNPALQGVNSFDFSTIYTTLDLDDLSPA